MQWFGWSTVILLVVAGVSYYLYQNQKQRGPGPGRQSVSRADSKETPAVATPFTALKQAQAIIQDAGAKHKAAYDTVEAMLDNPSTVIKESPAVVTPRTTATGVEPADAQPKAAPVSVQVTSWDSQDERILSTPAGLPAPVPGFVKWAQTVRIAAVRAGQNPRLLIGHTAYALGEEIDSSLGIVFSGYEASTRELRFTDRAGAVILMRR